MEGDDDELEDSDCLPRLLEDIQSVNIMHSNPPQPLFEGGIYFTQRLQVCGIYSRAVSIRGWHLFAEIRYIIQLLNGWADTTCVNSLSTYLAPTPLCSCVLMSPKHGRLRPLCYFPYYPCKFICYDDGCHLHKFAQNSTRKDATPTAQKLAKIIVLVNYIWRTH